MLGVCFRALRRFGGKKNLLKRPGGAPPETQVKQQANFNEVLDKSVSGHLKKIGVEQMQPKKLSQAKTAPSGKQKTDRPRVQKESLLSRLKKLSDVDKPTFEQPHGQISGLYSSRIRSELEAKRQRSEEQVNTFMRGESGIEVTPATTVFSVRYKRFISDLQRLRQQMTMNEKEFMQEDEFEKPTDRAERIRQYRELYAVSDLEADTHRLNYLISTYPGSSIGPLPQDDPETFLSYIEKNAPKSMIKLLALANGQQNVVVRKLQRGKNPQIDKRVVLDPESEVDMPYLDMDAPGSIPLEGTNPEDETYTFQGEQVEFGRPGAWYQAPHDIPYFSSEQAQVAYFETHFIPEDYEEVPSLPKFKFKSYQEMWPVLIDWVNFRSCHDRQTIHAYVYEAMELAYDAAMTTPVEQLPVKMGSLYYYYRTLPLKFQEHPALRDVYLGLEYSCPDRSLHEKEQALNFAAYHLLPMDPLSQDILEEHLSAPDKYQPTPEEVQKVYNMKPEFTWDIVEYMKEIKEEKLRGEVQVQQKEPQEFVKQQVYSFEPNGDANLPVDFYDNDDGFWDEYKLQKMARYESSPMLKYRPYLKH